MLIFRSAFEVLLGGGSQTRALGRKLAALLEDTSRQRPRHWIESNTQPKSIALNDTQWWFQSFALLRHAIDHGDEVPAALWLFPDTGIEHWKHADDHLRRAIKKTVIDAGHSPDLVLSSSERRLKRAYEAAEARLPK